MLDGTPLPTTNANDRKKLLQHALKLKGALDTSMKSLDIARKNMNEAKVHLHKTQGTAKIVSRSLVLAQSTLKKRKAAMRESPGSYSKVRDVSVRVKDTIAALNITADKRRDQLNQKRNSNTSSTWVQSLREVPGPLRKSLWYKMHRRRQQIVLRPSMESLVSDLRKSVAKNLEASGSFRRMLKSNSTESSKADKLEAELLKAEQSFLLAAHPVKPVNEPLSSVPSSTPWAEPGKLMRCGFAILPSCLC